MAEALVLTTPEVRPAVSTTDYRVVYLGLDWEGKQIVIRLRGTNGESRSFTYGGRLAATPEARADALAMMVALNTANLSTRSLQRRILERLVADGKLTGTVSGTPDTASTLDTGRTR